MGIFIKTQIKPKKDKQIDILKREIQKKLNTARKRVKRLERNNLQDTPAYQSLVKDGNIPKFGVRGKDFNELQKELSRINHFLNSETSKVRDANRILKDMASNIGMKYKRISEIQNKAKQFFDIASKVEQYLDNVEGSAGAIGYKKIWDSVNQYFKDNKKIIEDAGGDVGQVAVNIGELITREKAQDHITEIEAGLDKFF